MRENEKFVRGEGGCEMERFVGEVYIDPLLVTQTHFGTPLKVLKLKKYTKKIIKSA